MGYHFLKINYFYLKKRLYGNYKERKKEKGENKIE
jgi:hypothetical protein